MIYWFCKGITMFALLYYGDALHGYSDVAGKNVIVKDIMKKIQKIADRFSKASIEEKPKILSQIEEKLRAAATQSFGDEGGQYVELIMQGVKLKAFNGTLNVSSENSQRNFVKHSFDEDERGERIVKDHMAKKVTDKIEFFAKKYLMKLNSIDEKRMFLENVRKKMLKIVQTKHFEMLKGDIESYKNMITNSINDILKRNIEFDSRRVLSNVKQEIDDSNKSDKNITEEWLELSEEKDIDIENNVNEISNVDTECIVAIAVICSEVKSLNKFTCPTDGKSINVRNICDGIVDCSDKSDENHCQDQVAKTLDYAKNSLFEMDRSYEQNCLLVKINNSFTHQEIIRDWIKAQIDVINDYQDIFQHKNDTENNRETIRKADDVLNTVILNLRKGVCLRQEKATGLVTNARRFNRLLDEDLEEVLRESALFPKSCLCKEGRCVSQNCVKSCDNACIHKYRLKRWSCAAIDGSSSVHIDAICDGKIDCFDESDERDCSTGKGRGIFEANDGFLQIVKILEMKMASKENAHVRNELLRLYNAIIKLQNMITDTKPRVRDIKLVRNRCFTLLSLIYGNFMTNSYNSNEAEGMYRFLNLVNQVLVKALKYSNTGNNKLLSSYDCICSNNKCMASKCSLTCIRACNVENKLKRYFCKDSPQNRSVAVEEICNGKKDCQSGDDEDKCSEEVCRRHHLYLLRINIQDVGKKYEGTLLGETLKFWRKKATSMLLVAERLGRRSPQFYRKIIKDMLQDLVYVYASFDANSKNIARNAFEEFFKTSQRIINTLKYCGK